MKTCQEIYVRKLSSMRTIKIFNPDILFSDIVMSVWCKNLKNINGKIPIHQPLKAQGVYAIDMLPTQEDPEVAWFAASFPINRSWKPEDLSKSNSELSFDIIAAAEIQLNIAVEDDKKIQVKLDTLKFTDSENWSTTKLALPKSILRQVIFSGSVKSPNFLLKNIIIDVE